MSMITKPDFFIVGAPKCGTTAMDAYLSQCPDIFMARKEMHHFGKDLRFSPHFYRRDRAEYLREFEGSAGHTRVGESSVWYLFSETAAAELKEFNPESRVVIMLREPVEMLHSMHSTFCWDRNEPIADFEEAIDAENDRRHGRRLGRSTYFAQGLVYSEIVRYTAQIERYFKVFGRDRVHVVIFDDFKRNVAETYRNTLEFLEVDSRSVPQNFEVVNDNKNVRMGALSSVMNDPLVRSAALAVRPLVPRFVFNAMQKTDAAIRLFNSQPARRPEMDMELHQRLSRQFAPEVQKLEALLGRDLSHWSPGSMRTKRAEPVRRPLAPLIPASQGSGTSPM